MAYTEAQWNKFQASLPPEDRISYIDYLRQADPAEYNRLISAAVSLLKAEGIETTSPTTVDERTKLAGAKTDSTEQKAATVAASNVLSNFRAAEAASAKTDSAASVPISAAESAAAARAKAAEEQAKIDYATKILPNGLTQAQIDAIAGSQETVGLIGGKVDPVTGYVIPPNETEAQKKAREAAEKKIKLEQEAALKKAEADAKAAAAKAALEKSEAAKKTAAEAAEKLKRIEELRAKYLRGEPLSNEDRALIGLGPITASSATKKITSTTYTGKGKDRKRVVTYDDNTSETFPDPEVIAEKKIKSEAFTGTGANRKRVVTYDDNTTETFDAPETAGSVGKKIRFSAYQGTGANRKKVITYEDNTVEIIDDPEVTGGDGTGGTGGTGGTSGTGSTGGAAGGKVLTQKDIDDAVAAALAKQSEAAKAATLQSQRQSTIAILTERFNKYGLGSLAGKIRELAIDGATEATITLALQETPEYQIRFAANSERLKKNLQVLSPAEYLNLEDGYRQVLRAYGLKEFDTDEYVRQFISNDVSAAELSDRVVLAVQRVQNADPAVIKQLGEFYNIKPEGLVAYVLDPNQQLPKIQRKVAAAEIGAAAAVQGIKVGVSVADQLAAQGITQAEARKGYSTIADILPTAEKLSAIYGGVEAGYGLGEAEQEVFNSLAEAQRKRERLTSREIAAFSGRTGIARTGLTQSTQGQF